MRPWTGTYTDSCWLELGFGDAFMCWLATQMTNTWGWRTPLCTFWAQYSMGSIALQVSCPKVPQVTRLVLSSRDWAETSTLSPGRDLWKLPEWMAGLIFGVWTQSVGLLTSFKSLRMILTIRMMSFSLWMLISVSAIDQNISNALRTQTCQC